MAHSTPTASRTGRWLLTLFALPFAAIGLGMLLLSVLPTLYDWARMQFWEPVPAQLLVAELREKSGSKSSTTYLAHAQYRYLFAGQPYAGQRVAIGGGADNIGDFQQQLGQRLEQALAQGAPVTAWVNPSAPHEAVLDRSLRPGLLAFKLVFVVMFGGAGIVMLVFAWRYSETEQAEDQPTPTPAPAPAYTAQGLALEDLCQLTPYPGGLQLRQKTSRHGRRPLFSLALTGMVFLGMQQWMRGATPGWFAVVFGLAGGSAVLLALFRLAHSRVVLLGQQGLRIEQRLLGLPLRWQQWPPQALIHLALQPHYTLHQARRSIAYYRVLAQLDNGAAVTLASALPAQRLGEQLLRRLGQETGYPIAPQGK